MIGIVKEVFIPEEYINNTLIDVMDSTKIGFKVMLDNNQIIIAIFKQNEFNSEITKSLLECSITLYKLSKAALSK